MKLTKSKLKQIIREETRKVLREGHQEHFAPSTLNPEDYPPDKVSKSISTRPLLQAIEKNLVEK